MQVRLPSFTRELPFEFLYQLFALLIILIVVHTVYVTLVRPQAAADLAAQALNLEQDASYVPERSVFVIVRDLEQETCFILTFWAFAIMGYKGYRALNERALLEQDLIPISEGTRILPTDARSFVRHIQGLPERDLKSLLPRALLAALDRFASTRNIADVASTVQTVCESEGERLESELSMIRYIAWAIPSIGFIGTVRGIGQALSLAHRAMEGDISGVTQSLGVAFNSTFVALLLSLVVMLLLHQLQLLQERLVLDSEQYCDSRLIRHMATGSEGS